MSAEVSTLDSRSRRTYNETTMTPLETHLEVQNHDQLSQELCSSGGRGNGVHQRRPVHQLDGTGSTVMGVATSMLAYLNVSNIAGVAVQLQKKDPEKYPEPEGTINGNLIIDSTLTYFSSAGRHRHGPAEHRCGRGHRLSGHEVRFLKISTGHLNQNVVYFFLHSRASYIG